MRTSTFKLDDDEKRASDLLDKAIALHVQADRILARLPSVMCVGRQRQERGRLIAEASELRRQASHYDAMVDAIEEAI